MHHQIKSLLHFERDSQFTKRVLILSLPSAVLFLTLISLNLLSPAISLLCYAIIILFNMFSLFPISYELQSLRKYTYSLANEQTPDPQTMNLSEKDARELANAINSIHKFWKSQTDSLKIQTMSDAAVLDTLPDPILTLDSQGNITNCNQAARNFLGNDILSHNLDSYFSTNIFIASVTKVLKGKSRSESLIFHASEYNNRPIYAHITRLPWETQGRTTAVVSLNDISKALSLEKMQSDFVANASHELKTPLSVISGFIETLQTTARDDADARDTFLGIMKEQTEYMSALIEDLLSLSRLEMNRDKELKEKVDITEVIDDVVQALKIKAFNRSLDLTVREDKKIPKIIGDNQQIHQIVQNIIDNAIKYAQANSEVSIEIKNVAQIPSAPGQNIAAGKAVSIAVNNKGPKIDKADLARLTEKFYRMQVHKDMKIKGTGLGLSIAKQIILHHRGNLTVTSTSYNGTTFTVYLPVKQK
ncbi:MAG: PAS domain-containing protein [Alphaproteobacteria bacterium]|nr:PAS domain-containing protein [Alphaproteobacteria bacterium]